MHNFVDWLKEAAAGETYIYHCGPNTRDVSAEAKERIHAAYRWATEGRVLLTQKKRMVGNRKVYDYRATKTSSLDAVSRPKPLQQEK